MDEMIQVLPGALAVLVVLLAAAAYLRTSRHCAGNTRRTVPVPAIIEVRDPEAARRLIVDHADFFSDHPAVPFPVDLDAGHPKTTSINSAPYGPLWRVLRCNLTAGVLHPSRLAHLAQLQREAVEALVADLLAARGRGGAADGEGVVAVRDALYDSVFRVVARLCFGDGGVGERDVRAMQHTLRDFFHSGVDARRLATSRLSRMLHWRQWRHLVGTRSRLAEVFVPAIAARRLLRRSNAGGGRSYVDSLLDLRVPDDEPSGGNAPRRALRDDEMVRLVWEFLGAGTETVVACVEWTLAHLVARADVQEKLHRELSGRGGDQPVPSEERLQHFPYLRAVIHESLRLHPPVPFILRDVVSLPEGAAAAAAVGRAVPLPPPDGTTPVRFVFMAEDVGRDPKAWTDPAKFRPERFLDGGEGEDVSPIPGPKEIRMMPFGAGRRHCPGAGLAVIQAKCFVAALVREFEWAPPADGGGGGGVDHTSTNALFLKVMASPLRARIVPRRS